MKFLFFFISFTFLISFPKANENFSQRDAFSGETRTKLIISTIQKAEKIRLPSSLRADFIYDESFISVLIKFLIPYIFFFKKIIYSLRFNFIQFSIPPP